MSEDYHRARDVGNVKGETLPAGRDLGAGEIAALMRACEADPSPAGARDAAIIALMYATGLRRASAIRLNLDDYNSDTGALRVREARNKVSGACRAGRRQRIGRLAGRAGDAPGRCSAETRGLCENRRLSAQAVYNLLAKRRARSRDRSFFAARLAAHVRGRSARRGAILSRCRRSSAMQRQHHGRVMTGVLKKSSGKQRS
jgi:integrase